jgi:acyl-CoA synthetase (AMP-forming)/AMP-acid ligase II
MMPEAAHARAGLANPPEEAWLLHQFLEAWARVTPSASAVVEPGRSATYAELDALANRVAHLLVGRGVRRGDRVVIALDNGIELVASYFGAMKAGAVAVPLPPGPRSDRLAAAVADCAPAACIVDGATARDATLAQALSAVPHRWCHEPRRGAGPVPGFAPLAAALVDEPDTAPAVPVIDLDLAAIIYTSGSTGVPRGVMLRHVNFRANADSIVAYLGLTAADRVMCVLPLYYVYGLSLLHTHLRVGGTVVLDNRFTFPNVVLGAMEQQQVTGFAGVPSTFTLLLYRSNLPAHSFTSLRYVTQAGGSLAPARIREWLERGPRVPFYVMYGATEAAARLTYVPPAELERKLGSIGRAIPNVEIRVLGDDGSVMAPGQVGELVARGANIAAGYWNNPGESGERFTADGFRTGDLGYADEEGFLYLVGRRHDMMKVGAHRVGAKEIEDVLHEHPAVQEVAVVPAPHDLLGEIPVAFVAVKAGHAASREELQQFCGQRLAVHKVPGRFVFRPELPKMSMGKIDRGALARAVAAAMGGAAGLTPEIDLH